jgi:hypothetical protein
MNPRARSVYFSKSMLNLLGPVPDFVRPSGGAGPGTLHEPARDMVLRESHASIINGKTLPTSR